MDVGSPVTHVIFECNNIGIEPLRICKILPSCSCVGVRSSKDIARPGEGLDLDATLINAEKTDRNVSIYVLVAGAHRTYGYYLTAITRVPSPFTETSISAPKNCLYWFTDEPPLSKQIHIAGNIGDKKLLIKQLKSDAARSNFTCKVGAIKNQYLLDIRPIEGTGEIVEKWHLLYSLGTSDRCYKSEIELSVRKRHTY
jgi:hypothetical protein